MPAARLAEVAAGEPRLPTFLVIGAPKAGTTSLHHYLADHPEIFMAGEFATTGEELDFFVSELNWPRGVDWYKRQFSRAGDAQAVGESSPRYTQYPYHRGVPQRAAEVAPGVQLIYLVRHPIEQMLSHYAERRRWASERRPVNDALLNDPLYLETARYASHIDNFLACFPRERMHVLLSEQLRAPKTRRRALAGVLRFLRVDEAWTDAAPLADHNVGLPPRRWLFQRLAGTRSWQAVTAAAPVWLKRPVSPIVHRGRSPREELADRVRAELVARLGDDLARLRELVGPDVDTWTLGA